MRVLCGKRDVMMKMKKLRGSTETELTTVFDLIVDGYLLAAVLHLLSSYPYPRRPFRDLLG